MRYLYTIKDYVANDFGPIFEAKNHDVALRSFKQLTQTVFDKKDYALYCVGWFDPKDGRLYEKNPEMLDIKVDLEVVKNG